MESNSGRDEGNYSACLWITRVSSTGLDAGASGGGSGGQATRMTSTDLPTLSVRSPADLIVAVPYLLGFHPADSIVVVAMRRSSVVFAARADLPEPGAAAQVRTAAAADLADMVRRQQVEAVVVLGYGPAERATPAVDAVTAALRTRRVELLDALRVTDGRFWSYFCGIPTCCPAEGLPIDPTSPLAVAATVAGQVALPDRQALARMVEPVDGGAREGMRAATARANERLTSLLIEAPPADLLGGRTLRTVGESAVREAVDRCRQRAALTDDEVAWLTVLLTDLSIRDYAWEQIGDGDWHVSLWLDVLRRAEPDLVPAPASLLAFAAWRSGNGALAAVALGRALDCRPDYSMAQLMADVLARGIAPSALGRWPRTRREWSTRPDPHRNRRSRRAREQPGRGRPTIRRRGEGPASR